MSAMAELDALLEQTQIWVTKNPLPPRVSLYQPAEFEVCPMFTVHQLWPEPDPRKDKSKWAGWYRTKQCQAVTIKQVTYLVALRIQDWNALERHSEP